MLRRLETVGWRHDLAQEDCSVPRRKGTLVDLLSVAHVRKPLVRAHGCELGLLQGVDERRYACAQWLTVALLVMEAGRASCTLE